MRIGAIHGGTWVRWRTDYGLTAAHHPPRHFRQCEASMSPATTHVQPTSSFARNRPGVHGAHAIAGQGASPFHHADGSRTSWPGKVAAPGASTVRAGSARNGQDALLATLSHELRNPLQAVMSAVAVLSRQSVERSPVDAKALAIIVRQAAQMSGIIADLLDVSRLAYGKLALRVEQVDLGELLESAIDAHRALADTRQLRFLVHKPADAIHVCGDPVRLAQVLGNLLHNAVKFGGDGGLVEVTLQRLEGGSSVSVSIHDSGIGIAPGLTDSIFDLFRQAGLPGDAGNGLGVGLALVRGFVEMHGGRVWAASDGIGQGSTFNVVLPMHWHARSNS
jgi:signal transduction histidine kinase